ncbi:hypothetical protein BDD12DRAFT_896483 [Trichophaea hybrida]|nr:hypothetical protein BDD12DRAFT_896483 [Trichophaea hybrida]
MNWRSYLLYQEEILRDLEEKAIYKIQIDYDLTFADTRDLQRLRRVLLETLHALKGTLVVASGCEKHYEDLRQLCVEGFSMSSVIAIKMFAAKIQGHIDTVGPYLEQVDGLSRIIAFDTKEENHTAQNDAHSMKVLTFIAMLYLPASHVATIFSSSLIQTVATDEETAGTRYVITTQFWIFLLTISLMVLTRS